jgi:hypothetical protein
MIKDLEDFFSGPRGWENAVRLADSDALTTKVLYSRSNKLSRVEGYS